MRNRRTELFKGYIFIFENKYIWKKWHEGRKCGWVEIHYSCWYNDVKQENKKFSIIVK